MSFLNPWGFLFALFIPGIILLYFLKQQHEEIEVSSTFLWEKAFKDIQAWLPWQRLRRSLLLILQLMAIFVFVLAIARPFLAQHGTGGDYIAVLDCSASMQARDVKPTRFDRAKNELGSLIEGMLPDDRMTLIAAGHRARIAANRTGDKGVLKACLEEVSVTNGQADIEAALSLAEALARESKNPVIHLYTDKGYEFEDKNIYTLIFENGGRNRAVTGMSCSYGGGGMVVLSQITNYGDATSLTVECIADGLTVDVREIDVGARQTVDLYWDAIPVDTERVEVIIADEDDLMLDNRGWAVPHTISKNRVLMVTDRNIFLEKAISLHPHLELVKTSFEQAPQMEGYQLYIFDGYLPPELPRDGSVIVFNPQGQNDLVDLAGEYTPGTVRKEESSRYRDLTEYLQPEGFHIASAGILNVPPWAEVLLKDEEHPLMIAGERGQQRIAVFPFDLHHTDIPLKPDFPILIQNLMGWMLPSLVEQDMGKYVGEEVPINVLPHVQSVSVVLPSGETMDIAPPFPLAPFGQTDLPGIYKVVQRLDQETVDGYFTVHIPTHSESDLGRGVEGIIEGEVRAVGRGQPPTVPKELWHYFIWAVLLLIMVEWWVYQRGY